MTDRCSRAKNHREKIMTKKQLDKIILLKYKPTRISPRFMLLLWMYFQGFYRKLNKFFLLWHYFLLRLFLIIGLTHLVPVLPSYRNQSTDLLCKYEGNWVNYLLSLFESSSRKKISIHFLKCKIFPTFFINNIEHFLCWTLDIVIFQ